MGFFGFGSKKEKQDTNVVAPTQQNFSAPLSDVPVAPTGIKNDTSQLPDLPDFDDMPKIEVAQSEMPSNEHDDHLQIPLAEHDHNDSMPFQSASSVNTQTNTSQTSQSPDIENLDLPDFEDSFSADSQVQSANALQEQTDHLDDHSSFNTIGDDQQANSRLDGSMVNLQLEKPQLDSYPIDSSSASEWQRKSAETTSESKEHQQVHIYCDIDTYQEILSLVSLAKDEVTHLLKYSEHVQKYHGVVDQKIAQCQREVFGMYTKLQLVEQKLFKQRD